MWGFHCTVFIPALNGNKGGLFLNDQSFFHLVPEVLVFHFADLLDAVVLCHRLLGGFQVLGDVLGSVGVIVPTDGTDHSDLELSSWSSSSPEISTLSLEPGLSLRAFCVQNSAKFDTYPGSKSRRVGEISVFF